MNVSDIIKSKYLRKEDIGKGLLVTITDIAQETIGHGTEQEEKAVLYFAETEKPLVLNTVNTLTIADIAGTSENINKNWIGTQIVLFVDETIMMKNKKVGGVRVRAPKTKTPAVPVVPELSYKDDDGMPF
jgi:hypothetical protein